MDDPRILFEDTHIVVLNKPAGLLSQGDISGDQNLVDWLRVYFGRNYVGLVHRLDRNTSGLMVVAKRSKSANRLTEALQKGELKRSYIAIAEGHSPDSKELKHFLLKNDSTNETRVVKKGTSGAKEALLSYKNICRTQFEGHNISVLHIHLQTGRGHQIRAQLSYESQALLGDSKYKSKISAPGRPALHSYSLIFPHPMDKELMHFKEPLPSDLLRLLPKDIQWP